MQLIVLINFLLASLLPTFAIVIAGQCRQAVDFTVLEYLLLCLILIVLGCHVGKDYTFLCDV